MAAEAKPPVRTPFKTPLIARKADSGEIDHETVMMEWAVILSSTQAIYKQHWPPHPEAIQHLYTHMEYMNALVERGYDRDVEWNVQGQRVFQVIQNSEYLYGWIPWVLDSQNAYFFKKPEHIKLFAMPFTVYDMNYIANLESQKRRGYKAPEQYSFAKYIPGFMAFPYQGESVQWLEEGKVPEKLAKVMNEEASILQEIREHVESDHPAVLSVSIVMEGGGHAVVLVIEPGWKYTWIDSNGEHRNNPIGEFVVPMIETLMRPIQEEQAEYNAYVDEHGPGVETQKYVARPYIQAKGVEWTENTARIIGLKYKSSGQYNFTVDDVHMQGNSGKYGRCMYAAAWCATTYLLEQSGLRIPDCTFSDESVLKRWLAKWKLRNGQRQPADNADKHSLNPIMWYRAVPFLVVNDRSCNLLAGATWLAYLHRNPEAREIVDMDEYRMLVKGITITSKVLDMTPVAAPAEPSPMKIADVITMDYTGFVNADHTQFETVKQLDLASEGAGAAGEKTPVHKPSRAQAGDGSGAAAAAGEATPPLPALSDRKRKMEATLHARMIKLRF